MSKKNHGQGLPEELHSEGAILSNDFLERLGRVRSGGRDKGQAVISGLLPTDFHLAERDTLADAMTRAWNELRGHWQSWSSRLEADPAIASNRAELHKRWLLPLFQTLGFGRLSPAAPDELRLGEHDYPISHLWGRVPIHLVPWSQDLERPSPPRPESKNPLEKRSPHGLLQDFLNKSDRHLWGFVSNGRVLRILRDHRSLTRIAYLELDLERIFSGEAFHAFRWLWLLGHVSRVDGDDPERFYLERWFKESTDEGVRALESLRGGVAQAIERLATGFFVHPDNASLRQALTGESPRLTLEGYYRQLLRLVYRLIFVFVAEDREVLLDPNAPEPARARYRRFYATRRLRDRALTAKAARLSTDSHHDLWQQLSLVLGHLDRGYPPLALPALGGALFSAGSTPELDGLTLTNDDLQHALLALSTTRDKNGLRFPVSWRLVGAEELGSIYESLLELHLSFDPTQSTLTLTTAAGHARKTTGSYYTPSSLVECLLDTALDPVLERAVAGKTPNEAETALLSLAVVDPAVGSGHFLLAAGRRLAKRLAQVRSGEDEPALPEVRRAMRDIVSRCLYGVDLNEMAAELCKVGLWLEAIEPGRPLSFLDNHIQVGNALIGTTPELVEKGVPEAAWQELTGDDKDVVKALKKRHKAASGGQNELLLERAVDRAPMPSIVVERARELERLPDEGRDDIDRKEAAWKDLLASEALRHENRLHDLWCAAFVWPKVKGELNDSAPVASLFEKVRRAPDTMPEVTRRVCDELAARYRFFHWHLRFPAVMARGGFDVVLGNPPWERVKLQEKEWFAERSPAIANAENAAARKRMIAALQVEDPSLWEQWQTDLRVAEGESHLIRSSGRYPLCAVGDINTYAIFSELNRSLIGGAGRMGIIVPAGVAMDDSTKAFFQALVVGRSLAALFHFENEEHIFATVHNAYRFVLLTVCGPHATVEAGAFVAYARQVSALNDPNRRYSLSTDDFHRINPNTLTFPAFRHARDAEITRKIYRRVPILWRESDNANPWGLRFLAMFHMANDSNIFESPKDLEKLGAMLEGNIYRLEGRTWLPLYEAKMIHLYDHRFGTYEGQTQAQANKGFLPYFDETDHANPDKLPLPAYWVDSRLVEERLEGRWDRGWMLGWRDITGSEKARTVITSVFPMAAIGHTSPLILLAERTRSISYALFANLASFVFDYCARQKIGGTHLTFGILNQLPALAPKTFESPCPWSPAETLADWVRPRVLELVYTANDLAAFARDLGHDGPPFVWNDERRRHLKAELDAAFFHLYGLTRDETDYVLSTFPIVKRDDEARFGTYLTRDLILAAYDGLASGIVQHASGATRG